MQSAWAVLYCQIWRVRLDQIFPHYLDTFFGGKKILNVKYLFRFSLQMLSGTFLILKRTERDTIINVYWSSSKARVILTYFNINWIFRTKFRNLAKFHEKPSVGAELLHEDRRTDMTKLRVPFLNFVKRLTSTYLHTRMKKKVDGKW